MARGKKRKKKLDKWANIDPTLKDVETEKLRVMYTQQKERLQTLQGKRNYIQMDRDMVEKFFLNTRCQREEVERKIINKEAFAQTLKKKFKREIKYYEQKIKHMNFDQEQSNIEVQDQGQEAKRKEDDYYKMRKKAMTEQKKEQKEKIEVKEVDMIEKIEKRQKSIQKDQDILQDGFDEKISFLEERYEFELIDLQAKLLKKKVEIHEIEERKNQHINDLLRNHDLAFLELKQYYNDITEDNLNLIKDLMQDISILETRIASNAKNLSLYLYPGNELEDELDATKFKRAKLAKDTRQYSIHIKHRKFYKKLDSTIREKIRKMEKQREKLDILYKTTLNGKSTLEKNINDITKQVKKRSEQQNILLSKELIEKEEEYQSKSLRLQQIVESQNINPQLLQELNDKIKQSLEAKSTLIKNLTYSIHHATKAYNDAIRVYEAKLTEFGIPPEELGFQTLETTTSMMPAGLVSS